jgi:hypothetical protein
MPKVVIEVDKHGIAEINYEGFVSKGCDIMETNFLQVFIKGLNITKQKEDRKDQLVGEQLHV